MVPETDAPIEEDLESIIEYEGRITKIYLGHQTPEGKYPILVSILETGSVCGLKNILLPEYVDSEFGLIPYWNSLAGKEVFYRETLGKDNKGEYIEKLISPKGFRGSPFRTREYNSL